MKFTANLLDFSKLLQKVVPAIPPKSTLPVLEHLKFELKDNVLTVVATDQDISIMSSIEVQDGR
jgi:DNA polymerase III sliding clamp (beta) subunit (PCNA family)